MVCGCILCTFVLMQGADQTEAELDPENMDASGELSDEAIHRAEVELAGMFSGVISAVMSNVMRERPDLMGTPPPASPDSSLHEDEL